VLIGHGAINGREINRYEVDGGPFLVGFEGGITISFIAVLKLGSPTALSGIATVELVGSAQIARVGTYGASGDIGFDGKLLQLSALTNLLARAEIHFAPALVLDRSFIGSWQIIRRIEVPFGFRGLTVAREIRTVIVPEDEGALARQKENVIQ
jgi:hypothetical protein